MTVWDVQAFTLTRKMLRIFRPPHRVEVRISDTTRYGLAEHGQEEAGEGYSEDEVPMTNPEFGDKVCIADTPLTLENGFAGERGIVYGFTSPSITGISFIGTSSQDKALNVYFEHRKAAFWFAPELVEFVDHNPGLTVGVAGKNLIRRSDGGWDERPTATHPWWKFWA